MNRLQQQGHVVSICRCYGNDGLMRGNDHLASVDKESHVLWPYAPIVNFFVVVLSCPV